MKLSERILKNGLFGRDNDGVDLLQEIQLLEEKCERLEYLKGIFKDLIQLLQDGVPAVSIVPDYHTDKTEELWEVLFADTRYATGCTPLAAVESAVRKYNNANSRRPRRRKTT